MKNRIITPADLARRWGVHESTIWRMRKNGGLPPRKKVGAKLVWFESDIKEFEENGGDTQKLELMK